MTASATTLFFNDAAATEIYTLSLHDALPISEVVLRLGPQAVRVDQLEAVAGPESVPLVDVAVREDGTVRVPRPAAALDRKSTRLNSSHANISYAVFCLKKKVVMFAFLVAAAP